MRDEAAGGPGDLVSPYYPRVLLDKLERTIGHAESRGNVAVTLDMAPAKALQALLGAGDGGVGLIARERHRQIYEEGYSAAHDDQHDDGEILVNAQAILLAVQESPEQSGVEDDWGLVAKHWNGGKGHLRLLVIAGAMVAAEIDRLLREDPSRYV